MRRVLGVLFVLLTVGGAAAVIYLQSVTLPPAAAFRCLAPAAALYRASAGPRPASPAIADDPRAVYVAPDGDDRWSGRRSAPTGSGDGPVASLERARDIARASDGIDTILLRGGGYWLDRTVVFDERDAGLTLRPAPGEAAVLHGGPRTFGWIDDSDCHWSAPLALADGEEPAALFVDGRRETQARFPNVPVDAGPRDGWLFAAAPPEGEEWSGNLKVRFRPDDLPPIADAEGLTVHIVGGFDPSSQWGSDTLPVVSIDRDAHVLHTRGTAYFFTGNGSRYFLAGRPEFLDQTREWWYDRAAGRLRYLPEADATPQAISVGTLPTLIELDGAARMTIEGLGFRDGSPVGTGKLGTDTRGGGAIRVNGSPDVRLTGNSFENVGVAIHVAESSGARITGNRIAHVAGNGIYLGTAYGSFGRSDNALIAGNQISDVGEVYFESAGIWFQSTSGSRIANNLVERAAQFGIAGGSLWGPQDAVYDTVIELNEVRDANQQTADGGAIKMMGMQADPQRVVIRDNLVTGTGELMNRPDGTFWPPMYENVDEWPTPISWAIYLDGRASGVTIASNLVLGNVAGIGINGGWSNLVTGNVIADGAGAAFRIDDGTGRDWTPDWGEPNRIAGNVVALDKPDALVTYLYAPGHAAGYASFAGNLYAGHLGDHSFRTWPEIVPNGHGDLAEAQAAGLDEGSRTGDPGFLDPARGDYRLAADSPARALGYRDIPVERIGLAGFDGCADGGCAWGDPSRLR